MNAERYEIRGKIGQGGVGAVYRAFDHNLKREVAIKRVMSGDDEAQYEEATKGLLKEARALSAIQHPHIVTIYDCGVDADGPFVVMEILEGRTIEEMVTQGALVWEDFREVVFQTQEALIAAQDLDLIHRDIKPGNIMVVWLPSGRFQIKIVDFGLAKFSAAPSLQTVDHSNSVFGSIYFMAPEQFERQPLDQRVDMYAMGAIYYYALTGSYPFNGNSAAQVMTSHLQHIVRHVGELRPDIPEWAADWVMWQIQRDMEDRPKNARESIQRFLFLEKQHARDQMHALAARMKPEHEDALSAQANGEPAAGESGADSDLGSSTTKQLLVPGSATAPLPSRSGPQPHLKPALPSRREVAVRSKWTWVIIGLMLAITILIFRTVLDGKS